MRQLTNFPADMRIERWLKDEYPGIADLQRAGIDSQLSEARQVLGRPVREFTAKRVYQPSVTMNAAYALYTAWLYNDPALADPYRTNGYGKAARRLAEPVWETPDGGHVGDVRATEDWARELGLGEWFRWAKLDELGAER